jgi:hypothetical protein
VREDPNHYETSIRAAVRVTKGRMGGKIEVHAGVGHGACKEWREKRREVKIRCTSSGRLVFRVPHRYRQELTDNVYRQRLTIKEVEPTVNLLFLEPSRISAPLMKPGTIFSTIWRLPAHSPNNEDVGSVTESATATRCRMPDQPLGGFRANSPMSTC